MNSINPEINAMMLAYRHATGYDMPLNCSVERWCLESIADGMTPEDITLSIASRKRFNARHTAQKSLLIHRLLMSADDRAVVMCEAAEMRALARVQVMDKGKASVLRQSGRSDAVATPDAVKVDAIPLLDALRRAAQ